MFDGLGIDPEFHFQRIAEHSQDEQKDHRSYLQKGLSVVLFYAGIQVHSWIVSWTYLIQCNLFSEYSANLDSLRNANRVLDVLRKSCQRGKCICGLDMGISN